MRTVSVAEAPWMLMFTLLVSGRQELMFTIFAASVASLSEGMVPRIGTVYTSATFSEAGSAGLSR